MAKANPVLNRVSEYLRSEFSQQKDLDLSINNKGETLLDANKRQVYFTYLEVKEAMLKFKAVDPELYRMFGYHWQSKRTRNRIAESIYVDPSTLKRNWNKGSHILLNYLINRDICVDLEPIDALYIEAKANGTLANM